LYRKEYSQTWRERHPEQRAAVVRENNRRRRELNPERNRRISRASHLRLAFGLTLEDYDSLLKAQGGKCAICGAEESWAKSSGDGSRLLCVDHDHSTGRIRGLLCAPCNNLLGMAREDATRLRRAAVYLEDHRG
jgi:Autographiviridae endonuclease VII